MNSLHERYVKVVTADGREESLSALDASRIDDVEFVQYRPLREDVSSTDQGAVLAWIERADYIIEDLRWLLQLPYDRFWCQVIFDSSLHHCIDSYMNEAARPHDVTNVSKPPSSDVRSRQMLLHRLFFLVCLRCSTHRESAVNFIDGKVFGDILYENFIFDIPRLMDICVIYGHGDDSPLVSKMIGNVFQQQPKYNDDLHAIVSSVEKVFHTLCSKCGVAIEVGMNTPPKVESSLQSSLEFLPAANFEDIIMYLSDIAHTLNSFLKIYPLGAIAFWDRRSFLVCLAAAYECFAVRIPEAIRRRSSVHAAVKKQFRRSQVCLLRIFRLVVYHVCLRPVVIDKTDDEGAVRGIEEYLDVMNAVLSEKHFIAHLQVLFPFDSDRDIILKSSYLVDEPRLQYIEDAFLNAATKYSERLHQKLEREAEQVEFEAPDEDACSLNAAGLDFDSLVSAVCDLLPECGRGFVELCLEEFGYDHEKVINALLENNLPVNLRGIDRGLESAHDTSAGVSDNSSSLLSQRRNVFDGDEFDVFSRSDIDLARVHQGKVDKDVTAGGLETEVRAHCAKYGMQQVTVDDEADLDDVWEYDDEYDDTYDSNVAGAAGDADSADEMTSRRPFVVPRIFADRVLERSRRDWDDADGVEQDQEQVAQVKHRDAFVEDPAVLRQRREQQYAAQQQKRSTRRHAPAKLGEEAAGRSYDVKGAGRGQGQSDEVLRNRAWKEKNKASRVNHNRKALADRKRRV